VSMEGRMLNISWEVKPDEAFTPKGIMMLDLLSFLIFVFQANLLRRCGHGGRRITGSGSLISACEQELVPSSRSEQVDEIL
jgi:hypothetical protein